MVVVVVVAGDNDKDDNGCHDESNRLGTQPNGHSTLVGDGVEAGGGGVRSPSDHSSKQIQTNLIRGLGRTLLTRSCIPFSPVNMNMSNKFARAVRAVCPQCGALSHVYQRQALSWKDTSSAQNALVTWPVWS